MCGMHGDLARLYLNSDAYCGVVLFGVFIEVALTSVFAFQSNSAPRTRRANTSTRKSHGVFKTLQQRIIIGDLNADSVITEQALAEEFGCAQSTVREALLRLQEYGLVERRGYQGTFVTETTDDEFLVMLRLRMDIEVVAVERLIGKQQPAELKLLQEKADAYNQNRRNRDPFAVSEADIDFHLAVLNFAGLPLLSPILQRALLHLHRFIISKHRDSLVWVDDVEASHEAILGAVSRCDADLANHLILQHATTNTIEINSDITRTVFSRLKDVPGGWTS